MAWPSLRVAQLSDSLAEVEDIVDRPPLVLPDEIARALSRFLVVRACGYLEQVVEECCRTYSQAHSDFRVGAYAAASWRRGFNPTPQALVELVSRFDGLWAEELQGILDDDDERLSRSLSNLVSTRNKVAHGASEQVRIRVALDFASDAREVSDWFLMRFLP
jgi:hypothetical protein